MKNIVAALGGGAAADSLWTEGLHVAGERYVVFKVEGRSIYGRKVSSSNPPHLQPSGCKTSAIDFGKL